MTLPDGPIDVHCHVLPGVDDGCKNLRDAVRCIEAMRDRGYVGSICTPHFWPELFPDNLPAKIGPAVARLEQELDKRHIDYRLWAGAELRLDPKSIEDMETYGVPTLADSRYVLVDHWHGDWPDFAETIIRWLTDRDYQVVLAHPERMAGVVSDLAGVLDRVAELGVLLQGNFNSFTGGEGIQEAKWARQLARENRYFMLATDLHRPSQLESRFEGMAIVEIEFGPEKLAELTRQRPRQVLGLGS